MSQSWMQDGWESRHLKKAKATYGEKQINTRRIEKHWRKINYNKSGYAQAYAGELAQVRKMKNMVSGAKLILFFSGASGFTLFNTFW